jgi:hypothetical protein
MDEMSHVTSFQDSRESPEDHGIFAPTKILQGKITAMPSSIPCCGHRLGRTT